MIAEGINFFSNQELSRAILFFWLFSINNRLFFELNRDLFLNYYFSGRAELPKGEIIAFLKELIASHSDSKKLWSESTIERIASKYLTLLKKLGLLEGSQKKYFRYVNISDELLTFYVHIYCRMSNRRTNLLEDEFMSFSFIPEESMIDRLKGIAKKKLIRMSLSGSSVNVAPVFDSNTIKDGLSGRA